MPLTLKLATAFGPFTDMQDVELPDLSILTGLNGSGKTQLLRAIASGQVTAASDGVPIPTQSIMYVAQLVPQLTLNASIDGALKSEESMRTQLRRFKGTQHAGPLLPNMLTRNRGQPDPAVKAQLERIAALLERDVNKLLEEEVEAYAVAVGVESQTAHFSANIAAVGMGHLRTHYHQMRAVGVHNLGDPSLDLLLADSRRVSNKPAPWEFISSVLKPFGFRIDGPPVTLASAQENLELVMKKSTSGESVQPGQLSGGEQSLLALALAQYGTASGGGFPQLLLLDESLSALHPSIVSKALKVIADVFVEKSRTKVILVTHAPTVVALGPSDAIFITSREEASIKVRRASADEGIDLLTVGVPALRIDLENRHQVFVEGNIDDFVYSRLYEALRSDLPSEVSLAFVASGVRGDGGRSRVVHLVEMLRDAGNDRIRGLVDSDGIVEPPPIGVEVLCSGERDALENLVLDPLLLAFVLASTERGRESIGGVTQTQLRKMGVEALQAIVDQIVDKIGAARGADQTGGAVIEVEYVGGHVAKLPTWVLKSDGHVYATWVLEAFPVLRGYSAGTFGTPEDKLLAAVGADFARELRDYLPTSLLQLLRRLQARR
jgi:ABC-type branched-subunit amino acid transport system ATPase component